MMVLNNFLEDNILSVTHFLSEVVVSSHHSMRRDQILTMTRRFQITRSRNQKNGMHFHTMKPILSCYTGFSITQLTRLGRSS